MKSALFLLAILGLSQAASISQPTVLKDNTRALTDDLKEFLDLIPTAEILKIINDNKDDPQVVQVLMYIFSDGFKELLVEIGNIPEFKLMVAYLESAGLPVSVWIQKLKDYIGLTKFAATKSSSRSLNNVIKEVKAILPIEQIKALYKDKLANSPAFAELVAKLHSPVFLSLVDQIVAKPEVKRVAQELRNMGVDIDAFISLIKSIFGFNSSARNTRALTDDLKEFLDLLPTAEILKIINDNKDDPQVVQVLMYIFSDGFKELLVEIGNIPEFKIVVAYFEGAGLPVSVWIQKLKDYIGLTKLAATKSSSRSLNNVIKEIKAILPIEQIKALYKDKLANSPAFAELVAKLHSPVFLSLVDQIVAKPEVKRVAQELRNMGVDIDAFISLIKSIFGFNSSARNTRALTDDLKEFLDLLPTADILKIINNNKDDPQVVQVLMYIFSDGFKELLVEIGNIPEFKLVVAYLEGAGLPVSVWIQKLKDYIGLTKFAATKSSSRSLNNVIKEIKAILPIEQIKALYKDKLANSPAFAELVAKLHSPVFLSLVDQIVAKPEVKRVAQEVRNMGVDIDAFIDLIKKIFGFN